MARAKQTPKDTPKAAVIRAAAQQAADLLEKHIAEIFKVCDESDENKVTVNLAVELDRSESEAMVSTRLRFSQSVTDKRTSRIDDPAQEKFEFIDKPTKKKEGDQEPEGGDGN